MCFLPLRNEMRLSKSKILSYRQCSKKLWLELHSPELATESNSSEKNFRVGNQVGELSQNIYDPLSNGELIDPFEIGFENAISKTAELLKGSEPIFEAAFSNESAFVLADIMLWNKNASKWRMIEIKSSASVKEYHLDDVAIQYWVSQSTGVNLESISLGHIDSSWVYSGDGNYTGLIKEADLTKEAKSKTRTVPTWFKEAYAVARRSVEPDVKTGSQCKKPFDCAFYEYCTAGLSKPIYPTSILPSIRTKALKDFIAENNVSELEDIPDGLLNERQLRVKTHTLADKLYFDEEGAKSALAECEYPHYFLDFETINLAIPRWKGTRPFQQIPFQFSLHIRDVKESELVHKEFLDLSGGDPSRALAQRLIDDCGKNGSIFVYNKGFEAGRIRELANRFTDLAGELLAIEQRLFDLWPIAKDYFYHPSQMGSWSIKKVLPAISSKYNYEELEGVQDGGMAMDAFAKAIDLQDGSDEKQVLEKQLLEYCELDTLAMVEILDFFSRS